MDKEIAIIGCGAIGSELAQNIDNKIIPNCSLSIIFDIESKKIKKCYENLQNKPVIFSNFKEFIESHNFKKIDLVVKLINRCTF